MNHNDFQTLISLSYPVDLFPFQDLEKIYKSTNIGVIIYLFVFISVIVISNEPCYIVTSRENEETHEFLVEIL